MLPEQHEAAGQPAERPRKCEGKGDGDTVGESRPARCRRVEADGGELEAEPGAGEDHRDHEGQEDGEHEPIVTGEAESRSAGGPASHPEWAGTRAASPRLSSGAATRPPIARNHRRARPQ